MQAFALYEVSLADDPVPHEPITNFDLPLPGLEIAELQDAMCAHRMHAAVEIRGRGVPESALHE